MTKTNELNFGIEILYKVGENYPQTLKQYWGEEVINSPVAWFKKASEVAKNIGAKYICVAFNIEDETEIENSKKILKEIAQIADIELIIKGSGQKALDGILLTELIPILKEPAIIAPIQDNNYKEIVPKLGVHSAVLRTPIDINLTKELNILSIDEGLKKENIFIDPDMGCVGYGIDYGYSIIERIVEAREQGDSMLDMPIMVFTGVESYKAKETKSEDFTDSWGDIKTRSLAWEISTTTALICAGANVIITWHPQTIETIKGRL